MNGLYIPCIRFRQRLNFAIMEYIGLLFEVLLTAIGVYVYLFSRGFVRSGNPEAQQKADAFRQSNGWWLRIAGLALMAFMGSTMVIHIKDLLSK